MGELRLRGRTWWIRYYRNGRRFEESARTTKKTDAERLLKLREGGIAKGLPVTSAMGRFTFDEAMRDLLTDYALNKRKSAKDVQRKIELHLLPIFGGRRLATITTPDVRTYAQRRLDEGAKAAQVNRELAILKRMYSLAIQAGKLMQRPYIPLLKEKNVRSGFFEADQMRTVLTRLRPEARPAVEFAYITGWRMASEVLTLEWRNVDFASGEVRIDAGVTKNGEPRVFVMTERLRTLLLLQQEQVKAMSQAAGAIIPRVFVWKGGRPITGFRVSWMNACKGAGCPGRLVHDLRRTAVRNLVRAGIPERVAMQITGHKTRSVFERYNIVSGGDLKDAAARLDALAVAAGTKQGQSASATASTAG